ncbi:MAG: tRNA (adenosine(37)-N6)-threonylcarbamoyltransferase complex dimerization subunit type 1 TsaB [Rhodospirillaceae bacterium]|nr:MAG: tRNA (adenosine(37)-N6)-threonylcarbamoyltransferase complex dimerization subunit type 1 TsaB [Rhodospirillaceae bacterium]
MLSKTSGPLILAIDSATSGCSVCVSNNDGPLAKMVKEMSRGQAEVLIPMAEDVLKQAKVTPQDLDAIAVTNGPGAFTGLRIGLAGARGLALALGIPCVGITTLEVLAAATASAERKDKVILACVESKRADIYVQTFAPDLSPLSAPLALDGPALFEFCKDISALLLVGDAAGRAREMLNGCAADIVLSTADALPDPALIAQLAKDRIDGAQTPEPLYLRPPDAKLPKAQGRARA